MPVSYTIECTLCEHSIVTNEETEQADVPQNEHPPVFLSYRKLRFHTIRNAPRGSHCSGMEECRLRDPPQAENPASQDSFLSYRKLCFHTIINAPRGCALGARVDGCRGNRASARECAKAHSFFCARLTVCFCLPFSKSGKRFFLPFLCRKIPQKSRKTA